VQLDHFLLRKKIGTQTVLAENPKKGKELKRGLNVQHHTLY
jgi:hypothetical protein